MKISTFLRIVSYSIVLVALAATAFSQQTRNWKISDFLRELPKQYKTYEGDISQPTPESTFIDLKNGYAAYLTVPNGDKAEVFFEMAMFNSQKEEPTIVVSNYKYDFVCFDYDTFFLQKKGKRWVDVRSKVLPKLSEEMFFVDPESYEYYVEQKKKLGDKVGGLSMHFYPPREGTVMNVSLDLCDYVDDSVIESEANNFLTVSDALKTISLKWNKEIAKFEIVTEQQ